MKHRFGDQYARLESIRTYILAAGQILAEFREAEANAYDSDINRDQIDELFGDLSNAELSCQDMIDSIATHAAIEGGEKDTLLPPPMPLNDLDEPFKETP